MDMTLKGKKLLVLGGTRFSCEIVEKAQEMGLFVGVADYNQVEDSPGKQIADKAHLVDACDVDAVVSLIREEGYDGVFCGFADVLLPYYAEICEKAGLPAYGTREQFDIFINKEKYKQLLRQYDVPTVKEYEVDLERFEETSEDLKYPVLVKPVDSSGARGITVCYAREELKEALIKARSFSSVGSYMVEQYLTGREATVFWLFKDGKRYLTCIGNRHVKKNQEGVIPLPVGYSYPASVTGSYIEQIEPNVQRMFEAADIRNGMMFMQCKVEDGVCVVYDIGFRLTGSLEYSMLEASCGYNPLEMMIRFAITGSMGEPEIEKKVDPFFHGEFGWNVSVLGKPGRFAEINGCESIRKQDGVSEVFVSYLPGEEITQSMRGLLSQIVVRVIGTAPSLPAMKERMYRAYDSVSILSDQGVDMKLSGLDEEDFRGVV